MSNLAFILFSIGFIGFIFFIIKIIVDVIRKQDYKKNSKFLIGCFAIVLVSLFLMPTSSSNSTSNKKTSTAVNNKKEEKKLLTSSDKELLKKNYDKFDGNQRTQFAEIEEKYKKMDSKEKESIKSNYERLLKERDIQIKKWAEEEQKKKEELIKKNTKTLSAGEHTIGKHIDEGNYLITFNGQGNLFIFDDKGKTVTNEIGGSDFGITQYKAILPKGGKIKISGMSINTKPIESKLQSYSNIAIHAGYWLVGKDVSKGRYKVTTGDNSGNLFVFNSRGRAKTNEIMGQHSGVTEVIVDLEDGDLINICSMNNVKLSPEK